MIMYVGLFGHSAVVFHVFMFFVFFCVLLTVCVVCFISDILLIYSAVQLPVCLINLLMHLLTYLLKTHDLKRTHDKVAKNTGDWNLTDKVVTEFRCLENGSPSVFIVQVVHFQRRPVKQSVCVLHCSAVQTV